MENKGKSNILVLAPHADDEVLGCGATIRKRAEEGFDVYVAIMTNAHVGYPERYGEDGILQVREEALKAHELLGVRKTFFYDFPAPKLDQYPSCEIADTITSIIRTYRIESVYLPWMGDSHVDHKVVFSAGMVACRPTCGCGVKAVFAYETLSETEWAYPLASEYFIPNYYESLSRGQLEYKLAAMSCFVSQLREYPESRSLKGLEVLARLRGVTISAELAEAFMLLRKIE